MRRSERLKSKTPINYKTFQRVPEESKPGQMDSETKSLALDYRIVHAELDDFILEHQVDPHAPTKLLEQDRYKLEQLRNDHRSIYFKLEEKLKEELPSQKLHQETEVAARNLLADLITTIRSQRAAITDQDTRVIDDINSSIKSLKTSLEKEISDGLSELSDADITKRSTNIPHLERRINDLDSKITQLVQYGGEDQRKGYETFLKNFQTYKKNLNTEIDTREVDKHKMMLESNLKIELKKFGGYESTFDIFTFREKFDKFHLRKTPKHLLPDLLKMNYLESTALSLVKDSNDIDEIWKRLQKSFGDPQVMLDKKLQQFDKLNHTLKSKNNEKTIESLGELISLIKDTMNLAKAHNVEGRLYFSNSLEKLCKVIGEHRQNRWLSATCDEEDLEGEALWKKFITFLEKEIRITQGKVLIKSRTDDSKHDPPKNDPPKHRPGSHHTGGVRDPNLCFICGATDHVVTSGPGNSKLIQYFVCQKFVNLTPRERFNELRSKGLCYQCLYPGASLSHPKHKEGRCQRNFTCQNPVHNSSRYPTRKHVLVCEDHKHENDQLLTSYKDMILRKREQLPPFVKDMGLHFNQQTHHSSTSNKDNAIYQLQKIRIDDQEFLMFYDTGCSDFVSRHDAIQRLPPGYTTQEHPGPIQLGGIGDSITVSPYGIYNVSIPTFDNESTPNFTGVCLEKLTSTFPTHQLREVERDIHDEFRKTNQNVSQLPKLPKSIGGDVDFIIGIKYIHYHPEKVFQLPSGLTIYRSFFKNSDGTRGVIGGPHRVFNQIATHIGIANQLTFINSQLKAYQIGYQVNPDVSLLGFKDPVTDTYHTHLNNTFSSKAEQRFYEVESAGSEVTYRCIKCRSCKDCKNHDTIESISIQEEVEQNLIDQSVIVDFEKHETVASLPLLHNPLVKLTPNRSKALKVYQQQIKKLSKLPNDKNDVIASERKLHDLGHVDYVHNLPEEQQLQLRANPIQNFIPWRAVWKANSVSTPCRIVFDASQPTSSGFSLNNICAKGRNNMNKMIEILIRWSIRRIAYHTDISKMYNTVKLSEDHWCLQRYLWTDDLNPYQPPQEKIIKTLIYGVKSSGNQAEHALRKTANHSKDKYPRVNEVISKDVYVDDCISGEDSMEEAMETANNLEVVINKGGFRLKGFTFSGSDPPEALSHDGNTISVGGMVWHPKIDKLSLDISEMNFARKQRGKKPTESIGTIPSQLTRRHCISKVSEIFDPTGKLTPITAGLKLDLHNLVEMKLQWDDVLPDTLRSLWTSHFDMIQDIKNITFQRTIVPEDALNLEITTLDFGDASPTLACAAIYTRIQRKCGEYSSQLAFARSKLVPQPSTQPRAEMFAALLNVHTGEVVRRAFQQHHKGCLKITDNTIVLHWISNTELQLKQWVRNRVIEVHRLTDIKDWRFVDSNHMMADLATRRGVQLSEIQSSSEWFIGQEWMHHDVSQSPLKKVSEITLTSKDLQEFHKETQALKSIDLKAPVDINCNINSIVPCEVKTRYTFSDYVIDPNKFRFKTVVRVLAIVFKCIRLMKWMINNKHKTRSATAKIKQSINGPSQEDINKAEDYFFRKATMEVKHFNKPSVYNKISQEVNGILYYSGRFLQTEAINIITPMASSMHDLHSTSFFVPLVDKHSPLAYSIINEVHWYDETVKHSGNESTLRFVLKKAYVFEGREVIKRIKRNCTRCRYIEKKNISIEMGKLSAPHLTIAPAFYFSQIDLAGPVKAYCNHNRRSTIKLWMTVFCCMTTSATSIKIMDDYSTVAFIQAFIRFASQHGYPQKLFIDSGSQLIKGCEDIKLDFKDLQHKLHRDYSIEFEVSPVGAHNFQGKVERKIQEISRSIDRTISQSRLSVLQWETIASEISNSLNNMPLALGSTTSNFESMDLITPNRLLLGRNNERCPIGPVNVPSTFNKIIQTNINIFNTWFENWLISHVPKLISQPKWFKNDKHLKEDDIVLFLKHDSSIAKTYHLGRVKTVYVSKDGKIRKVDVEYVNYNENAKRTTTRSVRDLVVIHHVDELDILQELNAMFK